MNLLSTVKLIVVTLALGFFCVAAEINSASLAALLSQGRVDDAITSLQSKISSSPNDADAHNLLCRAYMEVENWDRGIAACQKAVALVPGNSQYHLWLGRVYGQKADHVSFLTAAGLAKKLRTELETAVRLDPANLDARSDLADFYLEAPGIVGGGQDKAAEQARQLATADPRESHLIQGRIAEKNKDLTDAEQQYRAAIQAGEGKPGPWLNLAQFYQRTGQTAKIQAAVQQALTLQNNSHILMPAARVLIRQHDLPQAIDLLRRYIASGSVEDDPAFKAHYLLGTLLEQQGDRNGAVQQYRDSLSMAKDFKPAQSALERLNREVADNLKPR